MTTLKEIKAGRKLPASQGGSLPELVEPTEPTEPTEPEATEPEPTEPEAETKPEPET